MFFVHSTNYRAGKNIGSSKNGIQIEHPRISRRLSLGDISASLSVLVVSQLRSKLPPPTPKKGNLHKKCQWTVTLCRRC